MFGSMSGFIDNDRFRALLLVLPGNAIKILYEKYYRVLTDIAQSLVHDRAVAEDVVQETFIHVWEQHRKLGQPDGRSIEHYLVRVVKNKAITSYKEGLKRGASGSGGPAFMREAESPERAMIGLEATGEIRKLILSFPRREAQCLLMRIDDGLTPQEIADRLGVSKKAVERSLTSANKRLRKYLRSGGLKN